MDLISLKIKHKIFYLFLKIQLDEMCWWIYDLIVYNYTTIVQKAD